MFRAMGKISGEEPLTLRMTFPFNGPTLLVDSDHPMAGPFRRAIEDGSPTGMVAPIILTPDNDDPRLLGIVALSRAKRLLFFPSVTMEVGKEIDSEMAILDHITLDYPRKDGRYHSHVTFTDGSHGEQQVTWPPKGHLTPWFSLLLPTVELLPLAPSVLAITFSPGRTDDRYPKDLMGDDHRLWTLSLPEVAQYPQRFLQIDFWAGVKRGWEQEPVRPTPWSYKDGVLRHPVGDQKVTARTLAAALSPDRGLKIVGSRPLGSLPYPRLLRVGKWSVES